MIYTAVLQELRNAYPALPVVLAETRSGTACMPHCGARLRAPEQAGPEQTADPGSVDHSGALLESLRERGVVQAVCEVKPGVFGCAEHPDHLFVGLGELERSPERGPPPVEGGFWIKAAVLVPSSAGAKGDACDGPEALGWWFLVVPGEDGWRVARRLPAFAV